MRLTTVSFRFAKRAGRIAEVQATFNRAGRWQKRLPDDTIADSPEERYTVPLSGLSKRSHALLIQATDARGTSSYETVAVTVP